MDGIPHPYHDVADEQPASERPLKSPWSEQVLFHAFQLHRKYPHVEWDRLHAFIQSNIAAHSNTVGEFAEAAIREGSFDVRSVKRKHFQDGDVDGDVGEGKPRDGASPVKRLKADYGSKWRQFSGGKDYFALALNHLQTDFPYISEEYLRAALLTHNTLYAPAYFFLFDEQRKFQDLHRQNGEVLLPYVQRTVPFVANKGKGRELEDAEFARERVWLLEELARREPNPVDVKGSKELQVDSMSEASMPGNSIYEQDCSCCFCTFPSNEMIACPSDHLFCKKCVETHTANLLVKQKSDIKCISTDGCDAVFSSSDLRQCLPEKLMSLWDRVNARKEVEAAGVILEDCPFCDWACFAADVPDILFFCGNTGVCGKISCRGCKKVNHLPKTCGEAQEDKKLEGRHVIEEAMTRALVRNCPHCERPFVKEDGCNKMTCPYCGALSCYICRKPITSYEHFEHNDPNRPGPSRPTGKCLLMDSVEERHHVEVTEAATQALESFKRDNPDVKQDDVKVALPPPPPPRPVVVPRVPVRMHGPPPPLLRLLGMALQPPPPQVLQQQQVPPRVQAPPPPAQFLHLQLPPQQMQMHLHLPQAQLLYQQPPPQVVHAPQYFPYFHPRMPPQPPVQRPLAQQQVQVPQYIPPRVHAPAPPPQNPLQGLRLPQVPGQRQVPPRPPAPPPPQPARPAPRLQLRLPQPQAQRAGAPGVPYLAARPAYPPVYQQNAPHFGQRLQDEVNNQELQIGAIVQHLAPRLIPRAEQYVHVQHLGHAQHPRPDNTPGAAAPQQYFIGPGA